MLLTTGALALLFGLGSSTSAEGVVDPCARISPVQCKGECVWDTAKRTCETFVAPIDPCAVFVKRAKCETVLEGCQWMKGTGCEFVPEPSLSPTPAPIGGCTDGCSLRYATEHMCDPEKNNTYETGMFLDRCPEACFLNGFDHGQCPDGANLTFEEKTDRETMALNYYDDLSSWVTKNGSPSQRNPNPEHGKLICTETRCYLSCDAGYVARGRTVTNLVDGVWSPDPRWWNCVDAYVLVSAGLPMSSTVEVYGQGFHKKLPNLKSPRMGAGTENVDGHIILCGGVPMEFVIHFPVPWAHKQCLRLNTDTFEWEEWVYTHQGRDIHGQVHMNGRLYWVGGDRSPDTMEWIEPNSYPLEWTLVDIPMKTKHCAVAKISETEFMVTGGFYEATAARIYNTETEVWTQVDDMEFCRSGHGSSYVEDKKLGIRGILVAGGYPTCDSEQLNERVSFALGKTSEFYNLDTGKWHRVGDLSIAKRGVRMIFSEGHALLMAGMYKHPFVESDPEFDDLDAYQFEHKVEIFDLKTETWSLADPLFEIRNFPGLSLIPKEWFPSSDKCSDDCNIEDATAFNCDRFRDNAMGSNFFLSRCPEKCYLAGYDYQQCPHGAEGGEPVIASEPWVCEDDVSDWMNGYGATCQGLKDDQQCWLGYWWIDHCQKTCEVCGHKTEVCLQFEGHGLGDGQFQRDETIIVNEALTYWRTDGEAFWYSCGEKYRTWALAPKAHFSEDMDCYGWAMAPMIPVYDLQKILVLTDGAWENPTGTAVATAKRTPCVANADDNLADNIVDTLPGTATENVPMSEGEGESSVPGINDCMRVSGLSGGDGDYQMDPTKIIFEESTWWRADKTHFWFFCGHDIGYWVLGTAGDWDRYADLDTHRIEQAKAQLEGFGNGPAPGVPCRGFYQATAGFARFKAFEEGAWRKKVKATKTTIPGACGLHIPVPFESASAVDVGFTPAGCGKDGEAALPSGVPQSHPAVPIPDFDICFTNARGHAQMFECLDDGNLKLVTYHDPECTSQRNIHDGHAEFTIFENGVCNEDGVEYSLTLNWDPNDCPIKDCEVGDFGLWSECSATCGGGRQTRLREVIQEKVGNGAECEPLSESRVCNEEPSCVDCMGITAGPGHVFDQVLGTCCASGVVNSCGNCGVPEVAEGEVPCECSWEDYVDRYDDLSTQYGAPASDSPEAETYVLDTTAVEQHWLDVGKAESRDCGKPDCNGVSGGPAQLDIDGACCLGTLDRCGVCDGDSSCVDCEGVTSGFAVTDACGFCVQPGQECDGTGPFINNDQLTAWCKLTPVNCKACGARSIVAKRKTECKIVERKLKRCRTFNKDLNVCNRIPGCRTKEERNKRRRKSVSKCAGKKPFSR